MKIRRTGLLPRSQYVRDARLFVVATEGARTEKQYFELFQSTRVKVEVVSTGEDNKSAPQHVLSRLAQFQEEYDLGPEDELWLVFDKDRWFVEDVAQVAVESGYRLAVSNPCFELWLLLHFEQHDPADATCKHIEKRLKVCLPGYHKAKLKHALYTRDAVVRAVEAAKKLDKAEGVRWPAFPGTHVYKLVEKLLEFWPIAR